VLTPGNAHPPPPRLLTDLSVMPSLLRIPGDAERGMYKWVSPNVAHFSSLNAFV
jgi:hypothetical protein